MASVFYSRLTRAFDFEFADQLVNCDACAVNSLAAASKLR